MRLVKNHALLRSTHELNDFTREVAKAGPGARVILRDGSMRAVTYCKASGPDEHPLFEDEHLLSCLAWNADGSSLKNDRYDMIEFFTEDGQRPMNT